MCNIQNGCGVEKYYRVACMYVLAFLSWGLTFYKGMVNWDKLRNDTSTQIQRDITNLHGLFQTLGIPFSIGSGLRLLVWFVRTR